MPSRLRLSVPYLTSRPFATRKLELEPLEGRALPSFLPGVLYPVGEFPATVVAGDFTGDAIADFAVTDLVSGALIVRPGLGDGSFGDAITSAGSSTRTLLLATGDFNADSILDLVTASGGDAIVAVHLGNGDGTFGPAVLHDFGGPVLKLAVGDFNGDSIADLVGLEWNAGRVRVLLNHGDGTFQPATPTVVGGGPQDLALADFNADGALDLVTANPYHPALAVLLGNGDGTFQVRLISDGTRSVFVTAGDFNFDGYADIATSNNQPIHTLGVLLNQGDGTFGDVVTYPIREIAFQLGVADFNADGVPDLVGLSYNESIAVLLGNGDGSFRTALNFLPQATKGRTDSLAVEDFNYDGFADLVYNSQESNQAAVLLNDGSWPAAPGGGSGPFGGGFGAELVAVLRRKSELEPEAPVE